jgi:hypothetical protein
MGQLTLSMGPARAEVCFVRRANVPSKRASFLHLYTPHMLLILCMMLLSGMSKQKYSLPCRLK